MASSTNSAGTIEHQLRERLQPVIREAIRDLVVAPLPASPVDLSGVNRKLDAISEGVSMVANAAILSSQEIAKRFEATRLELTRRMEMHEQTVARELDDFAATVVARIETLEALSFWTLMRLAARRLVGR